MSVQDALGRILVAGDSPAPPRLVLTPLRTTSATDGVWWPRSFDALAELPGLVVFVRGRMGPVTTVMLSRSVWVGDFRRLVVGGLPVRVGWFASLDASLAIVTTDRGGQLDLLVIPPEAEGAGDEVPIGVWDGEGGHLA
ncbi:hypothetical protein Afil01_00060 [Actinorhabdospora filicis]|uniref:Uncharacterized protein n=1 Tax=Actinorhabdospora filicis TaxID=1785913 RepID=A0A9W6W647_9ACTN|nr:DUF5994 family protein [Actinorhabdospora filicis]GLZ75199.1 hypothetical protein Afil01_00060 [Actinorhabdospora filicis]